MKIDRVRNFCIIAHIDHGKSTLADRILQLTGAISTREFQNQLLDNMDLERERGITIKASAVRVNFRSQNGKEYVFNLIDTPGHVDFNYEVSKSLRACEGAILVVDAAQGVEAQTVSNLYSAIEQNLEIIPVINKIDLPNADVPRVREQIRSILGIGDEEILEASAKANIGIEAILERVIERVPPPEGDPEGPLKALVFDSLFDVYKGVVMYVRVIDGELNTGAHVRLMSSSREYDIIELGVLSPSETPRERLGTGEAGYVVCNIRNAKEAELGDTITMADRPAAAALPGYRKARPLVFAGIYPVNPKDLPLLRDVIEKLNLNDSSFVYENENSASFGFGFRCGFLGLLHMEIIQERLEREYGLNLVVTSPSVVYQVVDTRGEAYFVDNPSRLPDAQKISEIREPFIEGHVIVPKDCMGIVLELCEKRRGVFVSNEFIDLDRVRIVYEFPLSEVIVDFNDRIKSLSRGYGSFDYEFKEYRAENLVKMDILLNGELCDALSTIVHRSQAHDRGRRLAEKLKEVIPRQMIEVAIQAAIGSRVIARETVRAVKK
ncbi:MAG: elongation factor 4, partial [Candidatus Omnitrophica bacterium]|nr:elongation factor 4 [Candidatus Omnitrophota bacterium]